MFECDTFKSAFVVGDIIWAKTRTFPWWPAMVSSLDIFSYKRYQKVVDEKKEKLSPEVLESKSKGLLVKYFGSDD
jgi:hypothetical protein